MSIIATYARLNADGLDTCRANPHWLQALFGGSIPEAEVIDIDKACDGLVWILSRLPPPAAANVEGAGFILQRSLAPLLRGEDGTSERRLDAPYGPASSLAVEQVQELSAWLQSIDLGQMRSRYDPRAMDADGVYPQIWVEEGLAALDDYLLPSFRALQAFFTRAANARQQILVFFT